MGQRSPIRRLVIDAAIPTKGVTIVDVAREIHKAAGVKAVRVTVDDVDVDVLGLAIVVEGEDIDYEEIEKALEKVGGVVHSIDEVVVGEYTPEAGETT
ncbi:MAG: DUF211 domain-containing protein [Pyrobaculum sp.]